MDSDVLADTQLGKRTSVVIVLTLDLVSTGSCSAIAVLCPGLPLCGKGVRGSRNTGTKGVAIKHLGWGTACGSRGVTELEETSVKLLAVNVPGTIRLEDQVLRSFDGCLGVAVRLVVMW